MYIMTRRYYYSCVIFQHDDVRSFPPSADDGGVGDLMRMSKANGSDYDAVVEKAEEMKEGNQCVSLPLLCVAIRL